MYPTTGRSYLHLLHFQMYNARTGSYLTIDQGKKGKILFMRNRYMKIGSVCFALVLACLLLLPAVHAEPHKAIPTAVHGVLDLQGWSFSEDGIVKLDGEWEFYWGKLLDSNDFAMTHTPSIAELFGVPNSWNTYRVDGKYLPGHGYATYRLKVKMSGVSGSLGLKIPIMSTAYRVIVAGQTVAAGGTVADVKERAAAAYVPQTVVIHPPPGEFELIVQVSNYLYARGGMWYALKLGNVEQMAALHDEEFGINMMIIGSALMLGLYHIVIYLLRRRNRSALFFGVICLLEVLHLLLVGDIFLLHMFPSANVRLIIFIDYTTYCGGITFAAFFMREMFPEEFSNKVIKPLMWIGSGFIVTVIVFPAEMYTRWINYYHVFVILTCIYVVYGLLLAVWRKRGGALLQLIGGLIFIVTLVHDIYFLFNPSNKILLINKQIVSFGMFALLLIEAAELARRFSSSFRTVETMSNKLLSLDQMKD
jgi:two-component system, sensor histidine kinase ChiS